MKKMREVLDGLLVSRWPLILSVVAIAAVLVLGRETNLALMFDLMMIAPAILGLSFVESKLLWDTFAKRIGFELPADRWASMVLFLGVLAANAWIVG